MVLSKRERLIAYIAGSALALVIVQWAIVGPLWERKTQLNLRIAEMRTRHDQDVTLIETSERAGKYWTQMLARNLPRDSADADQMPASCAQSLRFASI